MIGGFPKLTCKLNMEFIFWFENLDIEGAIWCKVFRSPSPQNSLVILWGKKLLYFTHAVTHL